MRIRAAVGTDLPTIVAIERASETAPHWAEAAYRLASESCDRCLLVAEECGILGFVAAAIAAGEAELESVVVDQSSRRRGIGRELCAAIISWARAAGASTLSLEVRYSSTGATALYRSLGFRGLGSRPNYYSAPPDDALILSLDLTQTG